jgi:alkaline phosphatase
MFREKHAMMPRTAVLSLMLSGLASSIAVAQPKRSVVLMVGDGFGASQMALGLYFARIDGRELHLESLMKDGNTGYALPIPYDAVVIDSAAAASQMATGEVARNETLGLNADGLPLQTILEWAEGEGFWTGLVSNMRVTHATPAGFASHRISRYDPESAIADQMFSEHDLEVLLGGGARAFVPNGRKASEFLPGIPEELDSPSNRGDARNLVEEAKGRGYRVVSRASELAAAAMETRKLFGLFSATHLPYVLDRALMKLDDVPPLAAMTKAALDVLDRAPRGFFLVVEGGRIDYAGHDNDPGSLLHEVLDFDAALGEALGFQSTHPETLVLVTADHGTGGFSFTYGDGEHHEPIELESGLRYASDHVYPSADELWTLYRQKASYLHIVEKAGGSPERLVKLVRDWTGLTLNIQEARAALVRDADGNAHTLDFREFYGDQDSNPACLLARALAAQTYVVWSTGGHTTEPVLTFGRGPGAEALRGVYSNTRVHQAMKDALSGRAFE